MTTARTPISQDEINAILWKACDTFRGTVDKYAYLAEAAEIAENDYILNIPRYVDTFEPEFQSGFSGGVSSHVSVLLHGGPG